MVVDGVLQEQCVFAAIALPCALGPSAPALASFASRNLQRRDLASEKGDKSGCISCATPQKAQKERRSKKQRKAQTPHTPSTRHATQSATEGHAAHARSTRKAGQTAKAAAAAQHHHNRTNQSVLLLPARAPRPCGPVSSRRLALRCRHPSRVVVVPRPPSASPATSVPQPGKQSWKTPV